MNDLNKLETLIGPLKKMRRSIEVYIFTILQFFFILFSVFSTNPIVKYIAGGLIILYMFVLAQQAVETGKRYRAMQEIVDALDNIESLYKFLNKDK